MLPLICEDQDDGTLKAGGRGVYNDEPADFVDGGGAEGGAGNTLKVPAIYNAGNHSNSNGTGGSNIGKITRFVAGISE